MMTDKEVFDLQEKCYIRKIEKRKEFLSDRENYLSSLRKNVAKDKRLSAEDDVERAKKLLQTDINNFEQFKKYKLYHEELSKIKKQINEYVRKKYEIYSLIGDSAQFIDMDFDKTKRDGFCL